MGIEDARRRRDRDRVAAQRAGAVEALIVVAEYALTRAVTQIRRSPELRKHVHAALAALERAHRELH